MKYICNIDSDCFKLIDSDEVIILSSDEFMCEECYKKWSDEE